MGSVRAGLAILALTLAGCTSGGSAPAPTPAPSTSSPAPAPTTPTPSGSSTQATASWPTYHGSNSRAGLALTGAPHLPLRVGWSKDIDGAVYAQPIVVGDTVVVATENNTVYALDRHTGHVRWRRHLATPITSGSLPCGNISPLGITGTPAYDAVSGLVFVVTEDASASHDLRALDLRTGHQQWTRNLDVAGRDRTAQQERGALLVAHHRVYVAFGGLFGDCGNYVGYVTAVATTGRGPVLHFEVPTSREGGIWAAPGPVQDPTGGDIYVAVGNGASTGGSYDGSNSVVRLSPTLHRRAFFAPTSWAEDNAGDLDLGSMAPVPVMHRIVIAGKRGTVYLLAESLGGIGAAVDQLDGCSGFGGAAVAGQVVFMPCDDGVRRLDVTGTQLRWSWQLRGVAGSPVVVANTVFVLDGSSGDLLAVNARSGHIRNRVHVGEVTRFATPAPAPGMVIVGTVHGVVAIVGRS